MLEAPLEAEAREVGAALALGAREHRRWATRAGQAVGAEREAAGTGPWGVLEAPLEAEPTRSMFSRTRSMFKAIRSG